MTLPPLAALFAGLFACTAFVACGNSDDSTDSTRTADGGTTGDDDDGGSCGTGTGACSMQVCPAGTSCTAAGVTATAFPCSPALAQNNSLPLITCNEDTVPAVAIQFTGDLPVVGTYDQTDTTVASATVICAGSLSGDYWAAGPADESALGTYSVTITSVVADPDTPLTMEDPGQILYNVHGSVTAQCVGAGSATGGASPSGVVSFSATF